jgi:hypothetical protein
MGESVTQRNLYPDVELEPYRQLAATLQRLVDAEAARAVGA